MPGYKPPVEPTTVEYVVRVRQPELLKLPFHDLIDALGQTPVNPRPCEGCGTTILWGAYCVGCEACHASS